jgi:hypothetical protein
MSNSPPTAMDVYRVCVAAHSPSALGRPGRNQGRSKETKVIPGKRRRL